MTEAPVQTLQTPVPPKFATVEEERRHRKERLAASFRLFARFGYDEGVAGHITARDPEHADHFWVNPFGMHFSLIRASDLILVNHQGDVVQGQHPVNRAAFAIHSRMRAGPMWWRRPIRTPSTERRFLRSANCLTRLRKTPVRSMKTMPCLPISPAL